MTPTLDDPLQSPQDSDSESNIAVPKTRPAKSPLSSVTSLPYRRSNASLSNLFASTTSLPTQSNNAQSPSDSGTVTPPTGAINGSVFSPTGSMVRSPSPSLATRIVDGSNSETRDLILRAFAPHVSLLASEDTEELIRHKGYSWRAAGATAALWRARAGQGYHPGQQWREQVLGGLRCALHRCQRWLGESEVGKQE